MSVILPSLLPGFRERVRITRRQFIGSCIIALLLHVVLLSGWMHQAKPPAEAIVIKPLSIKLGSGLSGEEAEIIEQASIPASNIEAIETSLSSAFTMEAPTDNPVEASASEAVKPKKSTHKKAPAQAKMRDSAPLSQVAKHYVRERKPIAQLPPSTGTQLGNKDQSPQMRVQAYTQTIALWLDKFKIYPQAAKEQGMQGRALVRIRIDRRGNIRYRILTERSAYPLLDKAVLDMVRRANPVPPVPDGYPVTDDFLEFVVPVTFKLD